MFHQDFREFVELLIANRVEYLIVGGYAVMIHGHPRYTGDLDIWINPKADNVKKVICVLDQFGFGSLGLAEEDFLNPDKVVQLGYPPVRIDILSSIDGVGFDEAFQSKSVEKIDALEVNFIGYRELIKNKKASGRHRDLDDIENLGNLE